MKIVLVVVAGLLVFAGPAPAADDEAVDIGVEVSRLTDELADVSIREAQCVQAARAGGSYSASSSSYSGVPSQDVRARGGSSTSAQSSVYSAPESRIAVCREQAKALRATIMASIQQAKRDPAVFAAIMRTSRARDRELQAQRAAAWGRMAAAVRQDLEALVSTPPGTAMGLGAFSRRLASLEGGLAALWEAAPRDGTRRQALEAVQQAIRALRVAREHWAASDEQAAEVAQLEESVVEARKKLAGRASWVGGTELEVDEHNLRLKKARLGRLAQQSAAAWRDALPSTQAALASLGP